MDFFIYFYIHKDTCSKIEYLFCFFWTICIYNSGSNRFQERGDDCILHRKLIRNSSGKYRHYGSGLKAVIDITRFFESRVFRSGTVYSTFIFCIEVSTFFSGFFHVFSCLCIEYVIYPTAEPITSITHSIVRIHKNKVKNLFDYLPYFTICVCDII